VFCNILIGSPYHRERLMVHRQQLTWIHFAPWSRVSKIVIAMEIVVQFQAKRLNSVLYVPPYF
jgi:hypothetical protein